MADYRVYFLGANGKIFASDEIQAESERDAKTMAKRLARHHASAFELWQGARCVHAERFALVMEAPGVDAVKARTADPG